jgi:hypothetical protein
MRKPWSLGISLGVAALMVSALLIPLAAMPSHAADEKAPQQDEQQDETFSQNEILQKAEGFFGSTTKGLAEAIQKVFEDQGEPNAYIAGEEAGGAFGVGLRYGRGKLHRKGSAPLQVYWQGPTIGFDLGGNASKVFALIYKLKKTDDLFQRYPGVEGSLYIVAGVSVNYQQSGETIIAPIRTGVGWRAGVNVGYIAFTREKTWNPF